MITVTGTTHPATLRARVAPIILTAGAVALVTVGLIGPDDRLDTAPEEVRVDLVDRPATGDHSTPEPAPPPAAPSTSPTSTPVESGSTTDAVTATVSPPATTPPTTPPTAAPPTVEPTPASTAVSTVTLAPLTLDRWVTGATALTEPVGPADDAAIRTAARQAWMTGLAARRAPADTALVAAARATRSGHTTAAFDSDVAELVVNGRRAVADPTRPSSQTIIDIALVAGDRALVTACTLDTDRVVDADGTAVADGTGVIRETVRLGLVRADGGWLIDDIHVVHRTVTDPNTVEVPPAC